MRGPSVAQAEGELGFHWIAGDGRQVGLPEIVGLDGGEPHRWLPTHLEALDDVLIEFAGRYGEVLGGGRAAEATEHEDLRAAQRVIDRQCHDYWRAVELTGLPLDVRAGQIIGTATLMSVRARSALRLMGPAPLDRELSVPAPGVVGGHAGLEWAREGLPWQGARWVVRTQEGHGLPATLSMLLFDSSGVNKDAARDEHREALRATVAAIRSFLDDGAGAFVVDADGDLQSIIEPIQASGAIDWLLFDWLMAHRDGPDSGAVEIPTSSVADARLIVEAAATSVRIRSRFDVGLLEA